MTDMAIRIAAVLAAIALVATPYWKQIAALLTKAMGEGRSYLDDIARVLAAAGLLAVAWGVIPITVEAALGWLRIGVGVISVMCAVALLSKRLVVPVWVNSVSLLAGGAMLLAGASLPHIQIKLPVPISIPSTTKATACVYVYEKDAGPIHPSILAALDKINRDKNIPATLFEQDTKDGTGETPEQYRPALEAAKKATLPAFVVLSGTTVTSTVSAPKELVVP